MLEFLALGGMVDVLDRYTNLVLRIALGVGLYGIRYQWLLARRLLAAEKPEAQSASAR